MTNLPFLKNKRMPRIAADPPEEKLIGGSSSDHIDDACLSELFDAIENRDRAKVRIALEALFHNMFEDHPDAA